MFYRRSYICIAVLLCLAFAMTACTGNQTVSPSPQYALTHPPTLTKLPTITLSPTVGLSLTPTAVKQLDPVVTPTFLEAVIPTQTLSDPGRLCADDDFSVAEPPPDLENPDRLLGFRPTSDWEPGFGWQLAYGSVLLGTDFTIAGYEYLDKYVVLLEKPVCRYGEDGRYSLSEFVDFVELSDLQADEIIINNLQFEYCCSLPDVVRERFEYQIEMFIFAECGELPSHLLIRAKYDLGSLPEKIEPGFQLQVEVLSGWFPNTQTEAFEQLPVDEISCFIQFSGK